MYDDVGYARSRLEGTIVRKDGAPVLINYLEREGGNIVCGCRNILSREDERHRLDDLDISAFSGFNVNYQGRVSYLQRRPMRNDWRQGMRAHNITLLGGMFNHGRLLESRNFARAAMNNYPSFNECMEDVVNGECIGKAYHKKFSLEKYDDKIYIMYRGSKPVGEYNDGELQYNDRYKYLKEAYEESRL